jgi:hypothetical protein
MSSTLNNNFDEIHRLILSEQPESFDQIKTIIENNPLERWFLSSKHETGPENGCFAFESQSIVTTAILCDRVDVYDLLCSKKLTRLNVEDIDKIIAFLIEKLIRKEEFLMQDGVCLWDLKTQLKAIEEMKDDTDKVEKVKKKLEKFDKINDKYAINQGPEHVEILIKASKLAFDNDEENFKIISKMLYELNEIPTTKLMIQAIALSDFIIYFDRKQSRIDSMHPSSGSGVQGLCCYDGRLYISASKQEHFEVEIKYYGLKKSKVVKLEALGTLGHECCHHLMYILFNNNCKPYLQKNEGKKKKFDAIILSVENFLKDQTAKKEQKEEVIACVFDLYTNNNHTCELIVRVPHLIALYNKEPEILKKLEKDFSELFKFYDDILVTLKDELPKLKEKHSLNKSSGVFESHKKSNYFSSETLPLDKIKNNGKPKVFHSSCIRLMMIKIFQAFEKALQLNFVIFVKLEQLEVEETFLKVKEAFSLISEPQIVINCEDQEEETLEIVEKLRKNKIIGRTIFVTSKNIASLPKECQFPIEHTWNQLNQETKDKHNQLEVNFGGFPTRLGEFVEKVEFEIQNIPLQHLKLGETVYIGKEIRKSKNMNFQRTFEFKDKEDGKRRLSGNKVGYFVNINSNNLRTVMDNSEEKKVYVLSAEPGMGKSTELQILGENLKKANPFKWIILVDLKHHSKAYQTTARTFETKDEIEKFLSKEILKFSSDSLEAFLFPHFFEKGEIIFLFDSFDEICPDYESLGLSFFKAIKDHSNNKQWISIRPHCESDLTNCLKAVTVRLNPVQRDQQKKFFEDVLVEMKLDENMREEKLRQVEGFLYKVEENYESFILNPLILQMIAQMMKSNDVDLDKSNLFGIYQQYYCSIVLDSYQRSLCLKTNFLKIHTLDLNILDCHQKLAFQTIFRDNKDVEEMNYNFFLKNTNQTDEIVRIGLVYKYDNVSFFFIHKTFAEFFVADFLFKKLFMLSFRVLDIVQISGVMKVFFNILNRHDTQMIMIFLEHSTQLMGNEQKSEEYLQQKDCIEKCFDYLFDERLITVDWCLLEKLIENRCINILTVISVNFFTQKDKLYEWWRSAFMIAAECYQTTQIVDQLFDLADTLFNREQIKSMIVKKKDQATVLHNSAMICHNKCLIFVKRTEKYFEPNEFITFLMNENEDKETAFSLVLECRKSESWDLFGMKLLEVITEKLDNKSIKHLLETRYKYSYSAIMRAACCRGKHVFEFILKLIDKVFENKKQQQEILFQEDECGETVLHYLLLTEDKEIFSLYKYYLEKTDSNHELKKRILEEKNSKKSLFLRVVNRWFFKREVVDEVWTFLRDLFGDEDFEKLLNEKINNQLTIFEINHVYKFDAFLWVTEMKIILDSFYKQTFYTKDTETDLFKILCHVFENFSIDFVERHFPSDPKYISYRILKFMLSQSTEDGKDLVHFAKKNENPRVEEFLQEKRSLYGL